MSLSANATVARRGRRARVTSPSGARRSSRRLAIETTSSEPSGSHPSPEGASGTCIDLLGPAVGVDRLDEAAVEVRDPPAPVVPARPLEEGPTVEQCGQFAHRRHPTLRYGCRSFPRPSGPASASSRSLGRRIAAVDDTDTYVCRPHQPGEIAAALVGHEFAGAHRRGKFLWLDTEDGPTLGLHLGMAGRSRSRRRRTGRCWDRFTVEFDDGDRASPCATAGGSGGRVLNPDFGHVGPDAAVVGRPTFRERIGRGRRRSRPGCSTRARSPGVGNLLADEALWRARLRPRRSTGELSTEELDRLRRAVRAATRDAIRDGGVHTGTFVAARGREGACPRCGHALARATLGGRTTYWCPECQGLSRGVGVLGASLGGRGGRPARPRRSSGRCRAAGRPRSSAPGRRARSPTGCRCPRAPRGARRRPQRRIAHGLDLRLVLERALQRSHGGREVAQRLAQLRRDVLVEQRAPAPRRGRARAHCARPDRPGPRRSRRSPPGRAGAGAAGRSEPSRGPRARPPRARLELVDRRVRARAPPRRRRGRAPRARPPRPRASPRARPAAARPSAAASPAAWAAARAR